MDFLLQTQRNDIPTIGKLGKLSESDMKRIFDKINVSVLNTNNCWLWVGTTQDDKKGHQHGVIWYNKKYVQAHRILYHNFIDDVPEYTHKGLIVLHKCDHSNNGRCVNPWHMKLGLPKENTNDAIKANTLTLLQRNEANPMSKLKNQEVEEIRALKNSSKSQREVAMMYSIHQSQISRYWNYKTRN